MWSDSFWKRIKNKENSEILIDGEPLGRNEGNLLLSIYIEQWPFCVSFSNSNFMFPRSIGFISITRKGLNSLSMILALIFTGANALIFLLKFSTALDSISSSECMGDGKTYQTGVDPGLQLFILNISRISLA